MKLIAPDKPIICTPVWPNVGVQALYYGALETLLRYTGADLVAGLENDWRDGVNVVGFGADAAALMTLVQRRLDAWARKWTKRWDKMADSIADRFATGAISATDAGVMASFAKAGFTIKFKPTRSIRDGYKLLVAEQVNLIKSIPQQYLKDVQTTVYQGVMKGHDMAAIQAGLEKNFGVASRRAAFIARDQNNKAKAIIENIRRVEVGIDQALWAHSTAGKVPRPTHVHAGAERQLYNINVGWFDPAVNRHIWPGTEINCRCTSRAVIPGLTRRAPP